MIKIAAFDLDGTIADTMPLCMEAFCESVSQYVGHELTEKEVVAAFGLNEIGMVKAVVEEREKQEPAIRDFYARYELLHREVTEPFPGILDLFANTAFTFLPILIAVSSARVFGGNIFLGAVVGMIMIHPNLINAWSVAGMDAADIGVWHLFGVFPIRQVGYQGHVIPVIIAVWVMSRIEKWLHKHVPEMIDLFVSPLCTVLITRFLTLGIIGPVFSIAETYVLTFAEWLISVGYGSGAMLMGALYPLTVVCGIHHMYNSFRLYQTADL